MVLRVFFLVTRADRVLTQSLTTKGSERYKGILQGKLSSLPYQTSFLLYLLLRDPEKVDEMGQLKEIQTETSHRQYQEVSDTHVKGLASAF